jgi:biopolymer transport protein ExbB
MLWVMTKGGPVMIPILIGSVLGLAIIIEKLLAFLYIRIDTQAFTESVFELLKKRDFESAAGLCVKNIKNPVAATLKAGIEKRAGQPHEIERVLERVGNSQIKDLERHIGGLISIIGIEPLLGFLGTITGLIRAFMAWEKAGPDITVSALASGIYEAMITTAAGLVVAVPYYLVCNFIISRIKYISYELSDSSMRLVEILGEAR